MNLKDFRFGLTPHKSFVQEHFPTEYTNHEIYNDWENCSIKARELHRWKNNVKTFGCIKKPYIKADHKRRKKKLVEDLQRAKHEVEEIKKINGIKLTASKLASRMGIHVTTANRYLNILDGQNGD